MGEIDMQINSIDENKLKIVKPQAGKYLYFELAGEFYGLDILRVSEINGMMDITFVPHTPAFMKGLINLRGKVIPIIDLRLKFGLPEQAYTDRTSIIVIDIKEEEGYAQMGIIVDSVTEVIAIKDSEISEAPDFGSQLKIGYISGVAKLKKQVVILLNIDLILTDEQLTFS